MKYRLLRFALLATFGLICGWANAQTNYADFRVKVINDDSRPMSGVKVSMLLNNIEQASDTSDRDGNVLFQTLTPGTYSIVFTKEGYPTNTVSELTLSEGLNKEWEQEIVKRDGVISIDKKRKKSPINMIQIGDPISGAQALNSGRRGMNAVISTNVAVVESRAGISVRGTRPDGNGTFIDGMRAVGSGALPSLGTDQLAVSIGGIRAMYGDLT